MSNMYNSGIAALGTGDVVWGTTTMKCMLVKSSYTFDPDHDNISSVSAHEISQGGQGTMSGCTAIIDDTDNEVQFDASDQVYTALAAGDTPAAIVVYKSSGGQLVCYCALTSPPPPNGSDYNIQWGAEGVFEISN